MQTHMLETDDDLQQYHSWLETHPQGSLWQSLAWKRYLEALGKEVRIYGSYDDAALLASALVVIDRTTGGLSVWDMPRGPMWTTNAALDMLLETIITDAKNDKAIAVYCSPSKELPPMQHAFTQSPRHIHPQATRIIDLTPSESDILAQMHQKGRYNIGVAKKSGVTIRTGTAADIEVFHTLLRATAERDGFGILKQSHYERFLTHIDGSFLLLAEYEGRAIAGLLGVQGAGGEAIYYYGASSYEHRRLMAPYLLQWEAMRLCKAAGCTRYDLLGISATNQVAQEKPARFQWLAMNRSEATGSWQGITDFKRKFGGTVVSYPPEQMLVLRPMVKGVLEWKRRILG